MVTPNLLKFARTPHHLWFRHQLGDNGDGTTFGPVISDVYCRWERSTKQIQLPTGRVVTLTGKVYVPASLEPQPGDLAADRDPDVDADVWREVVLVSTPVWLNGDPMHHVMSVT